jgi:hypothetical protein
MQCYKRSHGWRHFPDEKFESLFSSPNIFKGLTVQVRHDGKNIWDAARGNEKRIEWGNAMRLDHVGKLHANRE